MQVIYELKNIGETAAFFVKTFRSSKVFAFHGEMGAGKTTFIHAVCAHLQVNSVVGSPTYAIINEYKSAAARIFHIDLYRIKDEEEAVQAGVEECLYSGNFCFVEWPERAPDIFPPETIHVHVKAIGELRREIKIGEN